MKLNATYCCISLVFLYLVVLFAKLSTAFPNMGIFYTGLAIVAAAIMVWFFLRSEGKDEQPKSDDHADLN